MGDYHNHSKNYYGSKRRRYGLGSFLFDLFMVVITSGFWLIWIFVREMRR